MRKDDRGDVGGPALEVATARRFAGLKGTGDALVE
jgi:hypothetical protein